jgi:hypothetical protein
MYEGIGYVINILGCAAEYFSHILQKNNKIQDKGHLSHNAD